MRKSYWQYIENMIFYIDIQDTDSNRFNKQPNNLLSYMKSQKNENTGIAPLRSEGALHSEPTKKANVLNTQFQSVFTSESNINIPDKGPSPHPVMSNITITVQGINKLLQGIHPNKAIDPDNISRKILKEKSDICAEILDKIFTKSLTSGKVPSDWNHANIAPVYKNGDKHNPANYRPISFTCISCKLLEHIFSSNIMKHLEKNNILYNLQHGLRQNRSCETQIILLIHELASQHDKNTQIDLLILDFAKAFDKVPRQRLLYKLRYYGISPQVTNWVKSFLFKQNTNSGPRKYNIR